MIRRVVLVLSLAAMAVAVSILLWQSRELRPDPLAAAARSRVRAGTTTNPMPTARQGDTLVKTTSQDLSDGKRLYKWFNCSGCHANGGGAIGPALMDDRWIYGADPRDIYITIVDGRPNGMPSFRGRIPAAQVWQIVGYVRSLSGLVPRASAPGRDDDMRVGKPENQAEPKPPIAGGSAPLGGPGTP
jgi:cytochrome c oxidase cbb3-type subunit 3